MHPGAEIAPRTEPVIAQAAVQKIAGAPRAVYLHVKEEKEIFQDRTRTDLLRGRQKFEVDLSKVRARPIGEALPAGLFRGIDALLDAANPFGKLALHDQHDSEKQFGARKRDLIVAGRTQLAQFFQRNARFIDAPRQRQSSGLHPQRALAVPCRERNLEGVLTALERFVVAPLT